MVPGPTLANTAVPQPLVNLVWEESEARRFHIRITKDEEGTVSAVVLNLPGTGSCGCTEEEAMENVKEAIRGVLEVYEESQEAIPWKDTSSMVVPLGAKQIWITLDE